MGRYIVCDVGAGPLVASLKNRLYSRGLRRAKRQAGNNKGCLSRNNSRKIGCIHIPSKMICKISMASLVYAKSMHVDRIESKMKFQN